jgi:hypothetical protein
MTDSDSTAPPASVANALHLLVTATIVEAAVVIGHFAYSARLYEDPYRAHPIAPVLAALGLVVAFALAFRWKRWTAALWALTVVVGLPFVAVFGLYHGGVSHLLKLALYALGTSPERLLELFDSPDFALPNDFVFEASGVLCFVVAGFVAWALVRLWRAVRREPQPSRPAAVLQDQ